VLIVDDAFLLAILAEQEGFSQALLITASEGGEVFTTGSWFWRLGRALARPALAGSSEEERYQVHNALDHLPAESDC
jgi:hypothetical protein